LLNLLISEILLGLDGYVADFGAPFVAQLSREKDPDLCLNLFNLSHFWKPSFRPASIRSMVLARGYQAFPTEAAVEESS
jgi:hypothetical protein